MTCRESSPCDHSVTLLEEVDLSYEGILTIFRRLLNGEIYCVKEKAGIVMCMRK